jgi:hypothetical protein
VQKFFQLLYQRVGQPNLGVASQAQVIFGLFKVARCTVRHGERIMDHRRTAIECQRALQMLDRSSVVVLCQRHATSSESCRGVRPSSESPRKHGVGFVQAALVEIGVPQPEERSDIIRPLLEGTLEELRGFHRFALQPVDMG